MSLDALFLTYLTREIDEKLCGARVDKIYMPSRDEIVFAMRGGEKAKLLISASTNSPRLCLTDGEYENPAVPPTFCMVLRKHFLSARLKRVYMPEFERYVIFDFECKNDFFEPVEKNIIVELMGRSANLILTEGGKIIDAVRRVDLSSGGGRCILPSAKYLPPAAAEGKVPFDKFMDADAVFSNPELTFEKAIMDCVCGISPIVARELAFRAAGRSEMRIKQLGLSDRERLMQTVLLLQENMQKGVCAPSVIIRKDTGKAVDFCFMPVLQYGDFCEIKSFDSPSKAVDEFFSAGAKKARFEQKTRDLSQFINRTFARIKRTTEVRKKELRDSEKAEQYRIYGELINANLYRIGKGDRVLVCENYYDGCKEIKIPLKAELSPAQNAAAYFKKYNKAKNSRKILLSLIEKDEQELSYLESVFLSLCDCETSSEASQIRDELEKSGYLKRRVKKQTEKPAKPRHFEKDGFLILAGRNNLQNDMITVKLSRKNDIWLHTKNIHSSHVLISLGGQTAPDKVIEFAAKICAFYSGGKNDLKVEVDYCPVQNVRKPAGAKPGMVVYDGYNTIVVKPFTEQEINDLK